MIKKNDSYSFHLSLLILLVVVFLSTHVQGQFINVQIELEPELETVVLSNLKFGDIVIGSGQQEINLGDPSMGVFSITAINSQTIRFNLFAPNTLKHFNPNVNASIPIDLKAAYNNSGTNDPRNAKPFIDGNAYVQVNENARKDRFEWQTIFVYIYGFIDVGTVPLGIYEGQIRLVIDYE